MGLLSDVQRQRQLSRKLVGKSGILGILAYIVGFVWTILLAQDAYNAGTYLSENALLPGLVS